MKLLKCSMAILLALCMVLSISGPVLAAEDSISSAANLDLANGSIVITQADGVTTFTQNGTETRTTAGSGIIRQSNNGTATANTITVESGKVALTISGINITSTSGAPMDVKKGAALNLTLVSENTVVAPKEKAGVHVPEGAELAIKGSGSLNATGGEDGAGIGGGYYGDGGNITISGGMVTATGGYLGAGIGGGRSGDGGNITISGGTMTAIGGDYGAGIGGGYDGNGGNITINGGTVTATGGGDYGAGIGGGYEGNGGNIAIFGGAVTATGGEYGAGIGGGSGGSIGNGGNGGNITISGGTVNATGGYYGAGIGGGSYGGYGGTVFISNAEVTAKGYYHAIGGGGTDNKYGCDSVTIDSSAVVDLSYRYVGSGVQEKITINNPVLDSAAHAGNEALFTVDAYGFSGLTYQWQVGADNKTWADVDGATEATAYIPMSDGYYYRCQLTNGWGNTIYTNAVQAHVLAFDKQPTSVDAELDDVISFDVTPSCQNVTYQWQRSYDDGATWSDVDGEVYSTLIVSATLAESDAKYRCIITAANGDTLASDAVEINLDLGETVIYAIDVYQQTPDGTDYDLISHEVFESEIGEEVSAPAQTFDGFYENTELSVPSGVVTEDGSLVLARYFDRETYVIDFVTNGGIAVASIEALYGASVEKPDAPVRYGYTFGGWFADEDLTDACTFDTMPLGGVTLYAKWEVAGADRGIEYTINRMGMYDIDTHEEYKAIPKAQFLLEVDVTNECSNQIDTIMLVQYSADGQMLQMQYLYGKTIIGESYIFGTTVDNRDGHIGCIKAFVVPTVGNMVPLANTVEIGEMDKPDHSDDIAISTISISGATGSSDYIYYDEFVYNNGIFEGELWDAIEPASSLAYDYGRLKVKVNTDDSNATVYIESDADYVSGGDNETLYIEISEDEYDADCVVLYITVEDGDDYETEYELTIWLAY